MAYKLLQSIFNVQYGSDFRSTYEPFLWDWERFNKPIAESQELFGKTSALSVEGMYNHIKTPFSGVADFTGMGGRFQTEWMAGLDRNTQTRLE